MKDHIFSANDCLLFTNDRKQLGSFTFSHDRIHYQDRILYMIVLFTPNRDTQNDNHTFETEFHKL